jgi:hypothetical protein
MPTPNPDWRGDLETVRGLLRQVRLHDTGESEMPDAYAWNAAWCALDRLQARVAELATIRATPEAGLRWSREAPAAPGWYWWRNPSDPDSAGVIYSTGLTLRALQAFHGAHDQPMEYAGPIPPPMESAGESESNLAKLQRADQILRSLKIPDSDGETKKLAMGILYDLSILIDSAGPILPPTEGGDYGRR